MLRANQRLLLKTVSLPHFQSCLWNDGIVAPIADKKPKETESASSVLDDFRSSLRDCPDERTMKSDVWNEDENDEAVVELNSPQTDTSLLPAEPNCAEVKEVPLEVLNGPPEVRNEVQSKPCDKNKKEKKSKENKSKKKMQSANTIGDSNTAFRSERQLEANVNGVSDTSEEVMSFRTLKRLRKRQKEDANLFFGSCRFCSKELTLEECAKHMQLCHVEMTHEYYNCPICAKMTMDIDYHVRKNHHPNSATCDVCSKPFMSEKNMLCHRKVVHFPDDTDFVCNVTDECRARFTKEGYLKSHIKVKHSRHKTQVCDLCGKGYGGKVTLQRHLINAHGIGEKRFSCPQCGKTFASACNLQCHIINHNTKNDFKCTVCHKAFKTRHLLNQHLVCHKPPTHKCMICGKMFLYRAAGLGTHLKQVHKADMQGKPLC